MCLVTGLTATALAAAPALTYQVVAAVTGGTLVAQVSYMIVEGVRSLVGGWCSWARRAPRYCGVSGQQPDPTFPQLLMWPEADLDATSSTDFEDLAVFAADVFEFLQQEHALLVAVYGEARVAVVGGVALWALARTYRAVIAARRLK